MVNYIIKLRLEKWVLFWFMTKESAPCIYYYPQGRCQITAFDCKRFLLDRPGFMVVSTLKFGYDGCENIKRFSWLETLNAILLIIMALHAAGYYMHINVVYEFVKLSVSVIIVRISPSDIYVLWNQNGFYFDLKWTFFFYFMTNITTRDLFFMVSLNFKI